MTVNDKKVLRKINDLLKDTERNGNGGTGKPEALKHELSGFWSRRITKEHWLIYRIDNNNIYIDSCKGQILNHLHIISAHWH
ncbi:MAG: Txe/YoeB family addiction module toxin [Clostridia bacterium]|nr:Txe/YoeB family addiction module toxin [Clostridia bacterium]